MVLGLCPCKGPPTHLISAWFPHFGFFLQNKIQQIENLACVPSLRYVVPGLRQGKRGRGNLATPQRTGSDFSKPGSVLFSQGPASLALLPHPRRPCVPTGHQLPSPGAPVSSALLFSSSCSMIQLCLSTPSFPYSFLSLAGNQIRQVENLLDLPCLQLLDLSENLIETLKLGRNPFALAHQTHPLWGLPSPLHPAACACISHTPAGPHLILRGFKGLCLEVVALD